MSAINLRPALAAILLAFLSPCLLATADIITFYPTDDTMIAMNAPDNNYGSSETMTVRNRYGYEGHPDYWERDLLIRFDLSSIPPDTQISSATLHLYYYKWWDNDPAGRSLTCYRATSDWDEATVTWNTQPTRASDPSAAAIVPHQPGAWMTWDLTDDVQAFIDDPEVINHGWEIMDEKPWNWVNIPTTYFRTKEFAEDSSSFTPYLTVVPGPASFTLLLCGCIMMSRRRRPRWTT